MPGPIPNRVSGSPSMPTTSPVQGQPAETKQIETPKEQQPPAAPPPKPSDAEVAARKGEKSVEGTARQIELHNQLHQKHASASEFSAKAKSIAENPKLKEGPKQAELQKLMESAGKDEFGKLITNSKEWKTDARIDFNMALGKSEALMKRVASDLPPDAQVDAVHNVNQFGGGGVAYDNVKKWIKNADPKLLDKTIAKGTSLDAPGGMITEKLIFMNDKETINKLSDQSKAEVVRRSVSYQDRSYANTAKEIYSKLPPQHKNGIVDSLQEDGNLGRFVKSMDPKDVVQGMTPQNAGVIAAEYNRLATSEKSSRWNDAAGQIDGYAENHFNSSDYDEYLKRRERYHTAK